VAELPKLAGIACYQQTDDATLLAVVGQKQKVTERRSG
jgi:hypothetical protein